ncbi:hypothetical protein CC1G_05740 [Coprinopsis cinerea okayama7|uniref:Uncharacterized protein n=1 Tax=Coprinopsis cinerea (strain Okayama-7 / 130 / ATCC MYA-4618 / FGSC 9003) TaxID=240176 RepID=A8NA13_COPC7|nr:hypothetical protein CC1G_05740 [Coprinopsis cinerea okayama7\|eukprot:XP_001831669.1 hypothetical protein CC1G_05740 [Coprinopsis cinerea okayama7\
MLNFKKIEKLELCREAFPAPHGSSKLRESIQQTLALPSFKCLILSNIHGFPFVKEALRLQELVLIDSEPTPNSRVSFYLEVHKARPEINLQSLSFLGESDDCIGMFCPMPEIPNYLLSIPRLVLEASPLCFTFAFDRVTESGTSRLEHLVWLIPDNTPDQIFDFAALLGRQTFSTERLKHLEIIFPGSYPWSLERLMLIERLAGANLSLPALERITIELSGLVERLHALEASIGCFRFADQVPFGTRSPNFRELRINLTPGTELGNEHYSESHMHQARSFIERMFSSIDKSRLLTVNCVPRNSSAVIRDYHSRRPSPSHL